MVNKKGQEMSVTTLILIVIGVVLLVMLILGFSMGWGNLWAKINVFGGGGGLETVISACKIAATSDASSSYCDEFKSVTIANQKQYVNCQYSDVESKLDKTLACTGSPVLKQCFALLSAGTINDKDLYNGEKCYTKLGITTAFSTTTKCVDIRIGVKLDGTSATSIAAWSNAACNLQTQKDVTILAKDIKPTGMVACCLNVA